MIKLENVSKIYKGELYKTIALDNINLKIDSGEFVCIMGASGSGKSTMLNIIGCMDIPTTGNYYLNDRLINKLNSNELSEIRNKEISFIFQHFALMKNYTAMENVELPLLKRKMKRKERANIINQYFSQLGISELKGNKPTQMSGGQQQRVAIARALVTNPDIILADEPTGALDEKTSKDILNMLSDINKRGKTIVIVTHNNMVASYADRIINIKDGEILEEGNKLV